MMKQSVKHAKKRLAAGFLAVCLLVSQGILPIPVSAEETKNGGLCEHHPEHTAECGYAEEAPCSHVCSEETGCITKVLDCQHVHDSECGFTEAHACGYVCEICSSPAEEDSGTTEPAKETCSCTKHCSAEQVNMDCPVCKEDYSDCTVKQKPDIAGGIITEFSRLDKDILNQEVESGTALEDLILPDELEVSVYSEDETGESDMITVTTVAVTDWESDPAYDGETGTCVFTPELTDEYPVEEGIKAPKITVTVIPAQANGLMVNITGWEWIDPDEHLSDGALAMPGVNAEKQASFDDVVSLLPEQISAEIEGAAEPETINITGWKCPEYKQDNEENWPTGGSYQFTAVLTEGYMLSEGAVMPEIDVLIGTANVLQEGSTGDFIVTGDSAGYVYSADSRTLTVKNGANLTISGNTTQDKIVVERGTTAVITLNGLSIDVSGSDYACAFDMTGATVTLILKEDTDNSLISGGECAGLQVPDGATLEILGSGKLSATGGNRAAGIGSGIGADSGKITIGGNAQIMAIGGVASAGIGGSLNNNFSSAQNGIITIGGSAHVIAKGGNGGAGIGGGMSSGGGEISIGDRANVTAAGGHDSAGIGNGSECWVGWNITINGDAQVTATGGDNGTGIGSGRVTSANNTITINGRAKVKATGGTGDEDIGTTGIGNSNDGDFTGHWNITIGGSAQVKATGGTGGEDIGTTGIGNGIKGDSGTIGDNSVVFATGSYGNISNTIQKKGGLIIEGDKGALYCNSVTLKQDMEIDSGVKVTIESGKTLIIAKNVTLVNNGTIENNDTIVNNGTINNKGTIQNNGIIKDYGSITGIPVTDNEIKKAPTVTVTFSNNNNSAAYGENITIKATATARQANALARNAVIDTVDFWLGDIDSGTKLGTADVISGSATLTMDEDIWAAVGTKWTIGDNTITAEFGGTSGSNGLIENIGTAILKVSKADQPATSVAVSSTAATYGGTAPTITPVSVKDSASVTYFAMTSASDSGTISDVANISGTTITLNKAGTFYVKAEIDETGYYHKKIIYSDEIKVAKADSQFTVIVKKDSMATNLFIYGDAITVEVSGIQVRTANSRSALSENNVYLFAVDPAGSPDTTNAIASAAVSGGNATLTYETTEKKIAIGNNQTLWIAYGGSGNFKSATQTVEVTLAAKPLTATVESGDASAQKPYNGNNDFSNVKLKLIGIEGSDTVTATANGTTSDSDTGASKVFTANTVTLNGADKNWYSLAAGDISGNVNITKAAGKLEISCADVTYGKTVSPKVTANTGGTVTYSYGGRDDTSYGPSAEAPTEAGKYTVTGTAAATANYEQAVSEPVNFEIRKATGKLEISCADVTYGKTVSPKVTANTGGGTVTYSYEGRGGTSYGPSAEAPTNAGTYKVTGTAAATVNHEKATSATVNFEIRKATGSLVISCADVIYGEKVSPKATTNTGGGTVTYSYGGRDDTSYGPSTEAPTNAGTYKVTGTAAATVNHEKATSATVNFEIRKATGSLVISCADVIYGEKVSPKATTNTGGGAVTYSYEGRDGTGYGPSTEAPTEAGKYTVTGTAEATANHEKATSVSVDFEIRKAAGDLVISCADVIYGEKVSPSVIRNASKGTVTYSYEGRDGTSYEPNAAAPTEAGKYTVTGTAAATANYEEAVSKPVNFEIRKAAGDLVISCADVIYGEKVSPKATTNTGGGAVTYSYGGRGGTSYGPSAEAPTDAGTYKVTGTAEATANYEQAVSEPVNFEIRKATGNLKISCADVTYGKTVSPNVTINTGGGTVTYSYGGRGGTSYGPSAEAPTNAGKYMVTGTAAATANYEEAVSEPVNFEIRKATGNLVISCADVIYGEKVSPKATTNTGGGTVTYSYEGRDDTSYGASTEAPTEAGKYTVTGTAEATANYEQAVSEPVNFEIRKATGSLIISCADVIYGEKVSPSVISNASKGTVTYSYGGRGDTSYGPSAEAPTEAGKYTVTGTAEATANYEEAVSEPVNFEIRKATGSLIISCADVIYGEKVSPKATTNTGGGAVTYSYGGRDGTSYGPSTEAPTEAGKYTVTGTAEATANYEQAVSEPVNFEIRKAAGDLIISCADVIYGEKVSPKATTNTGGGAVTYSYEGRGGTSYGPSAETPTEAGKYTVTGTAAATANYEEAVSKPVNFEIRKAAGAAISKVTGSYTGDGSSFTYTIEPIDGAEYSRNGSKWQESNVFTDFHIGDAVTFYARMKEDQNHTAGADSNTGTVIFARLRRTENPALEFVISGATGSKKITITPVDGCEYTFDGGTAWGIDNTQVFATDDSPVIGIRYAQTDTHEASAGVTQKADLTNREQDAPEAFTLTFTNNGNGTFTAKIPLVEGGEYSFDGTNWSSVNTKSDCKPNTAYTGYVRLAAKDGYNAGPAVSDTRKTPELAVVPPVTVPDKDSSGDRDSGSEQTGAPIPPKTDVPATETIIIGAPDEDGIVTIPDEQMEKAVNNAKRTAGKNGIAIVINLPAGAGNAVLARDSMERLTGSGVRSFKMNFDGVALCFDQAALQEIARKTTGALTFGAGKETGLTGDALAAVGSRPAYNLTVSWLSNGKTAYVSSFGAGRVTVAIAYTPAAEERTGGLYAVRADGGRAEWLTGSGYDQNSRAVIFRTGHFSAYGVGYKTPPAFADTGDHWAKGDIDFAVSRGLLSGTGDTTFSPDDVVTRGMFVKALGRLAGIDPKDYSSVRFSDVSAAADYAPYAEWALNSGIVNGTGEKTFSPDAPITREEMAVFLQRYAVSLSYTLPAAREAVTFVDESRIAGDRRAAVRTVQQAGIMDEKDGRRFAPEDFVTRAEASAMLRRFVTVTTDPALADGFAQNDAGQWKYYLSGKPVIGWKQLEGIRYYFDAAGVMQAGGWRQIGGKWYYFYANGVLAVNTKIEEHEIGPDGAEKEN